MAPVGLLTPPVGSSVTAVANTRSTAGGEVLGHDTDTFLSCEENFISLYCQTSMMGLAAAEWPRCDSPYMSSMVRRTL